METLKKKLKHVNKSYCSDNDCEAFFSITIHHDYQILRFYCVWPIIKKWNGNRYLFSQKSIPAS